ncbi:hypothetical protein H7R52_00455 [Weissella confusa]|uniref:Uncharacterized protein n=1 Tax=Weissella confusa TaxID=1583 RepID=A0A923SNQ1_WEICO|nr:hypothetical protein [Weissella confusa]
MDKLEKKVDNRMTVRILGLDRDAKAINRRFKVAKGTSVAQLHRLGSGSGDFLVRCLDCSGLDSLGHEVRRKI